MTGTDQLRVLGKELQRAGRKDLKIEFIKQVNREARDRNVKGMIAESAREMLPSTGGHKRSPRPAGKRKDGKPRRPRQRSRKKPMPLNEFVAKAGVKVKTTLSGRNIGVRVMGKKGKTDLESINRGRVYHPTFGHKPKVVQHVTPGFFDKPLEGEFADDFRRAILRAVNNIRHQLQSGGSGSGKAAA